MHIQINHVVVPDKSMFEALCKWAKALHGGAAGVMKQALNEAATKAFKWALKKRQDEEIFQKTLEQLRRNSGGCMSQFSKFGRCSGTAAFQFWCGGKTVVIRNRMLVRAVPGGILEISIIHPAKGTTIREINSKRGFVEKKGGKWLLPFSPGHSQYAHNRGAHSLHLPSGWLPSGV